MDIRDAEIAMARMNPIKEEQRPLALSALRELESLDPLRMAADTTGKEYKDDQETGLLGIAMAMEISHKKEVLLARMGDTYRGMDYDAFIGIMIRGGYKNIFSCMFPGRDGGWELAHQLLSDDGVYVTTTSSTWKGDFPSIGCCQAYYCFVPDFSIVCKEGTPLYSRHTSTCRFERFDGRNDSQLRDDEKIWEEHEYGYREIDGKMCRGEPADWPGAYYMLGYHGDLNGLVSKLEALRSCGRFIKPWPKPPMYGGHSFWMANKKETMQDGSTRLSCEYGEIPMAVAAREVLGFDNWTLEEQEKFSTCKGTTRDVLR